MCLRFVFLLITRTATWLRLSRREETWRIAEILILRRQLAVLQRRQRRRPGLNWADRALLAILLGVIPKARWQREAGLLKSVPGFGDVVTCAWLAEIGPARINGSPGTRSSPPG